MKWYDQNIDDVARNLSSDTKRGLSLEEVVKRQKEGGKNELEKQKKASFLQLLLFQFLNPLIIILLITSGLKFALGGILDGSVILATIFIMIAVALFQEIKAERAMEALKNMAAPTSKVIREGNLEVLPSNEITVGDLISLEAGDKVPADGRLLSSSCLKLNESMLTGESLPVEKNPHSLKKGTDLSDRINMVYSGTVVVNGKGSFLVTAIGMETEIGKIAKELQSPKKVKTPLQKSIERFGNVMLFIIFIFVLLFVGLGWKVGMDWTSLFLLCVAIAVAAIPEGLPATVTIVLAAGVHLMSKKKAIIRRLVAVETLGATTVICTDKTGTLTENAMTLITLAALNDEVSLKSWKEEKRWTTLLKMGALCNDGTLKEGGKGVGDPTDLAILEGLDVAKLSHPEINQNSPRLQEIPFSSEKKFMATLNAYEGKEIAIVKGSPEILLEAALHMVDKEGKEQPINDEIKESMIKQVHHMGEEGLRVLGVAYKPSSQDSFSEETILSDLIFCGLFGMMDPPRKETHGAIEKCHQAGIEVVMVTGDHPITARAIAEQIGLKGEKVISGSEFEQLGEEGLEKALQEHTHFARIHPEHKLQIVRAFQHKGEIVAMTGDGVNDAPALDAADIGVSMGITGSEVAKESSDMILSDDNFSTIVDSIEEGRTIFNRLRNATAFLLTTCFGEVFTILFSFLALNLSPLEPLQILWINLITGSMIAIPLGTEPKVGDELNYPPRHQKVGLLFPGMLFRVSFLSLILAIGAFLIFFSVYETAGIAKARTMTFAGIIVFEWLVAFHMRSDEKTIKTSGIFTNRMLLYFSGVAFILFLALIYAPFFQKSFHTTELSLLDWGICLLPGLAVLLLESLRKRWAPTLFSYGKWHPKKWSTK